MRTDIAYVSSLGERVEFGGSEKSLHYFAHDLRNWSWEYTVGVAGAVTAFSRRPSKPRELSFPVGIGASTREEGIELRNRIETMGERDVQLMSPGRVYVGDWYVRAYVIGCEPTDYWMDDRFAELDLTLLVENPGWVKETTLSYVPETGIETGSGVDFPAEFDLEFKRERISNRIFNSALAPQDFLLRIYGPATNPYVTIGGNRYGVNVEVPAGSRLEIDSSARTVRLISDEGVVTGAYGKRVPGAEGSGSYIFQKVPVGESSLSWPNSFSFDLVLYEVRTSCPWEVG